MWHGHLARVSWRNPMPQIFAAPESQITNHKFLVQWALIVETGVSWAHPYGGGARTHRKKKRGLDDDEDSSIRKAGRGENTA